MRIVDLIEKKKLGLEHTKEEIDFIIDSLMNGVAADYQISAWLMAIYFQGMTQKETAYLTDAMLRSGEVIDLGEYSDKVVDKHSTGGVGDKVTITLIPLLAAAGIPIAKLSGRALGYTGGTVDKLESIPGFRLDLSISDMIQQLEKINVVIGMQTQNLTPADGKLYALRDVTSTVNSIPLIASSVVSKKLASGSNNIILDVKYGGGAFMETPEQAEKLSQCMVDIGKNLNRNITAVITYMDEPLGRAVGNSLEVIEAIEFLKGNITTGDIAELTYDFASLALVQMGKYDNQEDAKIYLKEIISSGKAIDKFRELIIAQGGNDKVIDNYDTFKTPRSKVECVADKSGYIHKIDAHSVAYASKILGAGRDKKGDAIDYSVGIFLNKKTGEEVKEGDVLYTIYSNNDEKTLIAKENCDKAFLIKDCKPELKPLIYKIIK